MPQFYTNFAMHMGNVLLREVVDGVHRNTRIKCRPYLFTPDGNGEYRTVHGKPVRRIDFDSTSEARQHVEMVKDVDGMELYGSTTWAYPFIYDRYPGEVRYDPNAICVAYIDIEVKSDAGFPEPSDAKFPITSIALSIRDTMYVFSTVEYKPAPGVLYRRAKDEQSLLLDFLEVWTSNPIDVVVGWNIDFFDAPYLVNRLTRILGDDGRKRLSPWGLLNNRTVFNNGKDQETWSIVGITIVDYMRAYQKFTHKPQESYSLNFIAHVELGEKKLDYSEYSSLNELYVKNPQKFIEYNIHDVRLMERLDKRLGLLDLIFTISYYCKINFDDAFGTVKMWETLIHNELMDSKTVVPLKKEAVKTDFEGGYVKDVQVGKHEWVVSFDFDSLYPHLIMALNISPETLQNRVIPSMTVQQILDGGFDKYRDEIGDCAVSGSCHLYSREQQGFFPKLMEKLYERRKDNRKKMNDIKKTVKEDSTLSPSAKKELETEMTRLNNLQLAMKYALNSGYGAMSNKHFLWFDMRMAESVTLSGQVAVQWVARRINEWLTKMCGHKDYIIAIDTDSAYVNLGPLVKKIYGDVEYDSQRDGPKVTELVDRVCKDRLLGVISNASTEWSVYHNAYADKLKMKREKIAEYAIWTAKKKYALWVRDDEGARLPEPELKVTGLEVVKSSTPAICRERMKEAIKIILTKDEKTLQDFVNEFRKDFSTRPFEEMAAPRGVNGIHTYVDANGNYTSGVPFHTRGAIVYNKLIEKHGLEKVYKKIEDGDKIKFSYMRMPNPMGENVLSCPMGLPKEFGLDDYVDYDLQFEKVFLQPIRLLLNTINWSDRPQSTLASFFG